ncbi:hypothetical protein H2198_007860 [Neophaeococcomyces mojaviensis]|uniref:Uncharacterized protein n=1 Tax=Neophaeococcomyces mojaviensis TaxID=3383035 RepID=A0ACC2ZYS0_9EURO|nr:hypothetical protein H2198_007860 [Knufia sp. JES_112]
MSTLGVMSTAGKNTQEFPKASEKVEGSQNPPKVDCHINVKAEDDIDVILPEQLDYHPFLVQKALTDGQLDVQILFLTSSTGWFSCNNKRSWQAIFEMLY